jgi:hypothetical protein
MCKSLINTLITSGFHTNFKSILCAKRMLIQTKNHSFLFLLSLDHSTFKICYMNKNILLLSKQENHGTINMYSSYLQLMKFHSKIDSEITRSGPVWLFGNLPLNIYFLVWRFLFSFCKKKKIRLWFLIIFPPNLFLLLFCMWKKKKKLTTLDVYNYDTSISVEKCFFLDSLSTMKPNMTNYGV